MVSSELFDPNLFFHTGSKTWLLTSAWTRAPRRAHIFLKCS